MMNSADCPRAAKDRVRANGVREQPTLGVAWRGLQICSPRGRVADAVMRGATALDDNGAQRTAGVRQGVKDGDDTPASTPQLSTPATPKQSCRTRPLVPTLSVGTIGRAGGGGWQCQAHRPTQAVVRKLLRTMRLNRVSDRFAASRSAKLSPNCVVHKLLSAAVLRSIEPPMRSSLCL